MTNKLFQKILFLFAVAPVFLSSCVKIPKGAAAVSGFEKEKYLGRWYEIARMDVSFERNLNNTTADYSINPDGSINVLNRGYNYVRNEWKEAQGKAKFVGPESVARLKVSFFGPFYGGYNVIALDEEYRYALVSGSSLRYLWILSRETSLPDDVRRRYLKIAEGIGYKTDDLIWVEHSEQ